MAETNPQSQIIEKQAHPMPPFPIDELRAAFPALAIKDNDQIRTYLDNPAGTQVPQMVIDAVADCFATSNANLGGQFATSIRAGDVVHAAHRAMQDFLGAADADEIIIGPNMTTLTLHMSRSICRDFQPGDEIVISRMDHEADISPWLEIAHDKGLTIKWVEFDTDSWHVEADALDAVMSAKTKLVALGYASNVTGSINDIKALTDVAKKYGALVFIDAVQFAPHGLVDVQGLGCDFLACSSYKFFGPHLGILWGRKELLQSMHAYKCRSVGDALPTKFETGTPQIELLAGLTATVDYFAALGQKMGADGDRRTHLAAAFKASQDHENALAIKLIDGLQDIKGVSIIGITNANRIAHRVPTVSFTAEGHSPADIAKALAAENIFIWSGHNYALEVYRQLGLDENIGGVRIGIAHYNTSDEIDRTLNAVKAALR